MGKYATLEDASNLKARLKKEYNNYFKVKELTKEEKELYNDYKEQEDFLGEKYPEEEDRKKLRRINRKLNGVKLTPEIKKNVLDVLKDAYTEHFGHTKPKWYQLSRRFAYWREKRAINSYEKMLSKKGLTSEDFSTARYDAQHTKVQGDFSSFVEDNDKTNEKITILDEAKTEKNKDFFTKQNDDNELSKENKEPLNIQYK